MLYDSFSLDGTYLMDYTEEDYTSETLPEFGKTASVVPGAIPGYFEDMTAALQACRDSLYLSEEELAILLEFSVGLGQGYLAEELSRCELAAGRLEGALAAAREGLPRTAGIYRTVALSGALAVILVFL